MTRGSNAPLGVGDVIQIHPDAPVNPQLRGQLAFVDELKSFGCTAGVESYAAKGVAYVRLEREHYTRIGPAAFVPDWVSL